MHPGDGRAELAGGQREVDAVGDRVHGLLPGVAGVGDELLHERQVPLHQPRRRSASGRRPDRAVAAPGWNRRRPASTGSPRPGSAPACSTRNSLSSNGWARRAVRVGQLQHDRGVGLLPAQHAAVDQVADLRPGRRPAGGARCASPRALRDRRTSTVALASAPGPATACTNDRVVRGVVDVAGAERAVLGRRATRACSRPGSGSAAVGQRHLVDDGRRRRRCRRAARSPMPTSPAGSCQRSPPIRVSRACRPLPAYQRCARDPGAAAARRTAASWCAGPVRSRRSGQPRSASRSRASPGSPAARRSRASPATGTARRPSGTAGEAGAAEQVLQRVSRRGRAAEAGCPAASAPGC